MADVTGDLGGQPIQLNNAATEATLKQLLAAILALNAMQAKNTKKDQTTQKELEKELRRLAAASKAAADNTTKSAEADKNAEKAAKAAAEAARKQAEADAARLAADKKLLENYNNMMKGLNAMEAAGSRFTSWMVQSVTEMANLNDSMSAAAASFGQIPIVGNLLSSTLGAVAGAAERTYKSFQQASSVGANFGGSITDMVGAATEAGLTFDQFSGVISKTSKDLAFLGGTTSAGAAQLAKLGKEMRTSKLSQELAMLGYSTEEINEGMATYLGRLQRTGALQGMNTQQQAQSTAEYLQNLDAVSKLTGQNKKDLENEREARMKDAQFRAITAKMDAKSRENLEKMLDTIPAEHRKGMMEIIATGTATSDAGRKALAFLPESAQSMMKLNGQIRQGQKVTADQAGQISKAYQNEATKLAKSGVGENMALYGDEAGKAFMVASYDVAARTSDITKTTQESADAMAKAKKAEQDAMSPAKLQEFQQQIAEVNNKFTQALANNMPKLMENFKTLADIVETKILPVFSFLVDNIEVAAGALLAFKAFQKLQAFVGPGKTRSNPMFVEDVVTGGGGGGNDKKGPKKGGGRFGKLAGAAGKMGAGLKSATGLIKGAGVVGALAGGVMLASDLSDISEQEKKGEITPEEAKKLKGGAVGGAAGGAGGAMAGAAAGAAIGSVVPIVGTVIGGLIGGAVGGWLGRKGGEAVGEAVASTPESKKLEAAKKKEREVVLQSALTREEELKMAEELKKAKEEEIGAVEEQGGVLSNFAAKVRGLVTKVAPGAAATMGITAPPPPNQSQQKNLQLVAEALKKQGITDPKMINATLGNVMKETGGVSKEENLNYKNTSNDRIRKIFGSRAAGKSDAELNAIKSDPKQMGEMMYGAGTKIGQDMGNTEPGDGFKYRGRGFIQLTGKNNYAAASKAIYGDDRLVKNPDLVNDPSVAAQVSAWYMKKTQGSMAKQLGIDTNNMTQEQANLLATSQVAGKAITPGKGYLGETLAKVNAYSAQTASIAGAPTGVSETLAAYGSSAPTNAAVGAALAASNPAASFQTAASATTLSAQDEQKRREQLLASSNMMAAGSQETPTSLLSSLNTKLDMLIGMNRQLVAVNERQLSVQKTISSSGNLFAT